MDNDKRRKKMRKFVLILLMSTAITATSANAESTLQADIDAGAVPLTSSQITSAFTNNTHVGSGWYAYYPEGKKRIVLVKTKTYKRKWRVDAEKGFCAVTVRNKKWDCRIIWKIGPKTYRLYDKKGKAEWTFDVEEGNIKDL